MGLSLNQELTKAIRQPLLSFETKGKCKKHNKESRGYTAKRKKHFPGVHDLEKNYGCDLAMKGTTIVKTLCRSVNQC